jgi:hypothetical protein
MPNHLSILGGLAVLAFLSLPCLPCNAAAPLAEDHEPYWEYRAIGDRILLKNPNATVEHIPVVYKGHDGLGTTWWDEDVRLTWYDTTDALCPSLASDGSYLHIARVHWGPGLTAKIFYKRSCDLGYTWDEDVQISNAPEQVDQGSPDITISTTCLHAVWGYTWKPIGEQGHIYYRRSLDQGATWEDIYYLSSYDHQSKPSVAALGDTVYVVFKRSLENPDRTETHLRKSYDEGGTWTDGILIADYGAQLIRGTLRANEEGLHYVFQHKDNFDDPSNPYRSQEIFYIHSPDFGDTWTDPIIVSHRDSIHSQWPWMCVDDEGTIHVTWFDYKYSPYSWTGDIFYTKSTDKSADDGQFWSEIRVLTDTHLAGWSNITARGKHLYLVFEDERHGSHNNEVYFRHSPNRGNSWDAEKRLTNASKESYTPVITEQADTLYVVWEDHRHDPTNRRSELYFKRGGLEAISIKKSASTEYNSYLIGYPNPFNEKTIIRCQIVAPPELQIVSLKIYNVQGQLVKVLFDHKLMSGRYHVVWDGSNSKGSDISSGVYLCVLQVGHDSLVRRILHLK